MITDANVQFTGELQVEKLPQEYINVTLDSSLDTGWTTDLTPPIMYFGPGQGTQNFTVNVTVPYWASADRVANLHVTATWTGPVTVSAEGNATVTVKAFYGMNLGTDEPVKQVPPGGHASFKVRLDNIGNSRVSYRMSITNEKELTGKGLMVKYEPKTFDLPDGYAGFGYINISAPREWTLDKNDMIDVEVMASFDNNTGTHSERISLEFWVSGPDALTLQVLYDGIAAIILAAAVLTVIIVLRRRWRRNKK